MRYKGLFGIVPMRLEQHAFEWMVFGVFVKSRGAYAVERWFLSHHGLWGIAYHSHGQKRKKKNVTRVFSPLCGGQKTNTFACFNGWTRTHAHTLLHSSTHLHSLTGYNSLTLSRSLTLSLTHSITANFTSFVRILFLSGQQNSDHLTQRTTFTGKHNGDIRQGLWQGH